MSQGMAAKVGLHHTPVGRVVRLILRARNLVDDNLFFRLKIALGQARVHHIAQKPDGPIQVLAQHTGIVHGGFMRGKSVKLCTDFIELQGDLLPIQRFGALENHVL